MRAPASVVAETSRGAPGCTSMIPSSSRMCSVSTDAMEWRSLNPALIRAPSPAVAARPQARIDAVRARRRDAPGGLVSLTAAPTTEIYTLSLHDALPIFGRGRLQERRDGQLFGLPV